MGKCKRVLALALTFIMIIACAACGKKNKTLALNEKQMASKDYIYSCQELDIEAKQKDYNYVQINNGYIVGYTEEYIYGDDGNHDEIQPRLYKEGEDVAIEDNIEPEEDVAIEEDTAVEKDAAVEEDVTVEEDVLPSSFQFNAIFTIFTVDGKKEGEVKYTSDIECNMNGFYNDEDGNVYFIINEYGTRENGTDNLVMYGYSKTGEEMFNVPLGENVNSNEWYTASIGLVDSGKIYVFTTKGLDVFNTLDGTLAYDIANTEIFQWSEIFKLKDGSFATLTQGDDDKTYLSKIDLTKGKEIERVEVPFSSYTSNVYAGSAHDLIINSRGSVYTYDIGDTQTKMIMDTIASDCESEYLQRFYEIDEKSFLATWYSNIDRTECIGKFTKVEPKDVKDKTQITVGVINLDDDIRKQVLAFNKKNDEYKIVVKYYTSDNGYDEIIENINNDIIAGNMPDIMVTPSEFSIQNYVSKGLIEDLYPYMDNDSSISREDYLQNIFEACSEGEHMYQLIPRFYIQTVVAKTELVGDGESINITQVEEIMKQHPEIQSDFALITRDEFISGTLRYNLNQFVNWETGEVNFNSQEFINALEHAKNYPAEINWDEISQDYWNSYDSMYLENRSLLDMAYLYEFRDYAILKQGTFGNVDINFVGFPNERGKGNVASPYSSMMISSKSPCKEGAWEFVKYFISDEYQDGITSGFPVKISSLEKNLEKAKQKKTASDGQGEIPESDDIYWINGAEMKLNPLSDQDGDEIMKLIKSIDAIYTSESKIEEIINEEAAGFYSGQKTAADVANVIQSRVQIYVDENR